MHYNRTNLNPEPLTKEELKEAGLSLDFIKCGKAYTCTVCSKRISRSTSHFHAAPKGRKKVNV
jgi:hypothetical protein